MEKLIIKSVNDDSELVLSALNAEHFTAQISSPSCNAVLTIYSYAAHHSPRGFFNDLGKQTTSWNELIEWESLEGDFKISAECDSFGHVTFVIKLNPSNSYRWKLVYEIESELGSLPAIAKRAGIFFEAINF